MGIRDALRAYASVPKIAQTARVPVFEWPDGSARLGHVEFGGASRSLSWQKLWGSDLEGQMWNSASGERVDTETALRNIAVQAAIRLLVNDVGSLPVDAFRNEGGFAKKELTKPPWVVEPNPLNPNATWEDHVKQTVFGMLTDGGAVTRCFPNTFRAEAVEAWDPATIEVRNDRGAVTYRRQGDGQNYTPAEVLYIPWMKVPGKERGLNPIEYAREGLGIARASDQFVGSYFGNGAVLSGWIKFPAGADPTPQQVKDIKDDFARKHVGSRKSHAVGGLTGGAEYIPFDYNNRDAQLIELRDFIVEDVARLFGIPPHMLGSQKPGAVGYASVEQRSIDYVTHAILPIVRRIEVAYSRLLRGQRTYLKFNVRGLLQADHQARAAYFDSMLQNKIYRREEVRALEDLPFDPEGVGYLETPNNNAPEEPAPESTDDAA